MNVQALLELAEAFRQAHPKLAKHGFVLIFEDEVTGWKRRLLHPETELPGTYAVGVDSTIFQACGGDWMGGARSYLQIYPKIDQEENEC